MSLLKVFKYKVFCTMINETMVKSDYDIVTVLLGYIFKT